MGSNRSAVLMGGPLGRYERGFRAELDRLGYAKRTAHRHAVLMERLSHWLEGRGLDASGLTLPVAESFLSVVRDKDGWFQPTTRTLMPLLNYLREQGAVPVPVALVVSSPVEDLLARYQGYLVGERGLANGTVEYYLDVARLFVSDQIRDEQLDLATLSGAEVIGFVTRQCAVLSVGSARILLCGLRAFLRFAHLDGWTSAPLTQVVPSAAGWSGSGLPRGLAAADVTRMLASCDRQQPTGRRDHAILVLLVRLGLRAGEVAGLTLDDVDWRAGEIVVRGKGRREEPMPLPVDVGEAIVGYLRQGRQGSQDRALFLRAHAPVRAMTANGVSDVVRASCDRAGLPRVGAHRLRHTAATQMLGAGASLSEVTQVLRQRNTATAAIYAKVDHRELAALVRPWPVSAR